MHKMSIVLIFVVFSAIAVAEEESTITASNGVVITITSDKFADRYEYTSPRIKIRGTFEIKTETQTADSFAVVSRIKNQDDVGPLSIAGMIYSHDVPSELHNYYYGRAIFKGGDSADFAVHSRVPAYRCGAYGCIFYETFQIKLTSEQVEKYAENGVIPMQIRAIRSSRGIANGNGTLEIPVTFIDAVNQVAIGGVQ